MSTKTKGIAFHREGERLTMKANEQNDEPGFGTVLLGAILTVGVLLIIGNILFGLD